MNFQLSSGHGSVNMEVLPGVVGRSRQICEAARQVPLIARSNAPCLLLGETGTGKELFARAMHYLSPRSSHPFVPLNCGAVGDQVFENELFGHAKGAYTDARSQEDGLLAYAEGGTLFLDEVDSLSSSAQVKLLRVLQEREYRPLGSARTLKADVRVLAASNCDVRGAVEKRRFREDLYHRLNVLRLVIPPLRERVEDIPLLAEQFVREFAVDSGDEPVRVSAAAMDRLVAGRWSGNVRELHGVLHRALLMHTGPVLESESLEMPEGDEHMPYHAIPKTLKAAKDVAVRQFEQQYLSEVLRSCQGNVSAAARAAGKERRSFQRLLRKHNVGAGEVSTRLESARPLI
jgi:two-component system response regulator GlrR